MMDDDDRPLKEIKIQGIKFHFVGLSDGEKMGRPLSMRLFDIIFFSEIHCLTHRAISTFLFLFPRVYTISFTYRRFEEMKQTYRQPSQVTPSFWYFGRFRKCLTGQRLFQSSWTQKIFWRAAQELSIDVKVDWIRIGASQLLSVEVWRPCSVKLWKNDEK